MILLQNRTLLLGTPSYTPSCHSHPLFLPIAIVATPAPLSSRRSTDPDAFLQGQEPPFDMSKPIADYTPQVAIVTGAAKGIGRAIALRLASDGFKVVVNDRLAQEDALNALAAEIHGLGRDATETTASGGVRALVVTADVSIEVDVDKLIQETVRVFGGVDAVIANAGIALGGVFLDCE